MSTILGTQHGRSRASGSGGEWIRPLARRSAVATGLLALTTSALVAAGGPARAAAPDFNATAGVYTVDTDALTLTGPGANFTGSATFSAATFTFHSVSIPSGATVNVHGSRTFTLVAEAGLVVGGVIDGSGTNATDSTAVANPGGPGGGAGGADFTHAGVGPGGGQPASTTRHGAGGGGFGGRGARGGFETGSPGTAGAAGVAYGNLDASLQGGSGGAGGSNVGGGGGGGAIALYGASVSVSGAVHADGGGGDGGNEGASGGGSGGAILVHGGIVSVTGMLSATGGPGGVGGCCGDGGGGGGGRIAYQYQTLVASGTALVTPGTSGARTTVGLPPGPDVSPDPTGAAGVVTKTSAPDTAISRARISSAKHKARFWFAATGSSTSFECRLKKPHKAGVYRPCTSPKTYRHLKHGRYKFFVRAIGVGGADPTPAVKRFRIH